MQIARGSHQTEEIEKNEDVEGDGRLSVRHFKLRISIFISFIGTLEYLVPLLGTYA